MNKKELKQIANFLSPEIAKTIQCLEGQLDNHFIEKLKYKKSDYLVIRKIVTDVLVKDTIPSAIKQITDEYTNYCIEKGLKKFHKKAKIITKK